jgi:hypothetical protein
MRTNGQRFCRYSEDSRSRSNGTGKCMAHRSARRWMQCELSAPRRRFKNSRGTMSPSLRPFGTIASQTTALHVTSAATYFGPSALATAQTVVSPSDERGGRSPTSTARPFHTASTRSGPSTTSAFRGLVRPGYTHRLPVQYRQTDHPTSVALDDEQVCSAQRWGV